MLSTDVWLEQAHRANMQVGHKRRFEHNCGEGQVVMVSYETKGYSAFCFRCNDSVLVRQEMSLKDKAKLMRTRRASEKALKQCRLPSDFTNEIPVLQAVWLYKHSVRKQQALDLNIGYSPSMNRVVIPVYSDTGELAFIQARAVSNGQQPKYLNSYGTKASSTLFTTAPITHNVLIITEDILSAIRCGKYATAAALCGTSVSEAKILKIIKAKTILIWLDADTAGQKGTRKFIKALGVLHSDVRKVYSKEDPKCLTNHQIKTLIEGALNDNQAEG